MTMAKQKTFNTLLVTLLSALSCMACEALDSLSLARRAQELLMYEQNHGFPFAQVHALHSDTCTQSTDLVVERGQGWVWAPLQRLGVGRTRDDLLVRMSLLEPGTPVALGDLPKMQRLFARSGWFSEVGEPKLYRSPDRNSLVPAIPLHEALNNQAELWFAYQKKWTGHLLLDLNNIAGTGRSLHVSGEKLDQERSANLSYSEPYPLGLPLVLQGEVSMDELDSLDAIYKASMGATWQLDYDWLLGVHAGEERAKATDTSVDSKWAECSLTEDLRDQQILTHRGWLWNTSLRGGTRRIRDSEGGDTTWPLAQVSANWGLWLPLVSHLGWAGEASGAALWPVQSHFLNAELFELGGSKLAGYWPASIRTRAYTYARSSLLWNFTHSQASVFAEGAHVPHNYACYGLGWAQERSGTGIDLRLAWTPESAFLEALVSLTVHTRF